MVTPDSLTSYAEAGLLSVEQILERAGSSHPIHFEVHVTQNFHIGGNFQGNAVASNQGQLSISQQGANFIQKVETSGLPDELAAALKAVQAGLDTTEVTEDQKAKVEEQLEVILDEAKEAGKADPGRIRKAIATITETVKGATHLVSAAQLLVIAIGNALPHIDLTSLPL